MNYTCPNCPKAYELGKEDYDRITAGKHIHIICNCDVKHGLNIIVGADHTDYCGEGGFEMYSFELTNNEARRILANEAPPLRYTNIIFYIKLTMQHKNQIMPPKASDCI